MPKRASSGMYGGRQAKPSKPRRDNVRRVALERVERDAVAAVGVGVSEGVPVAQVESMRFLYGPLDPQTWEPLRWKKNDGSDGGQCATVRQTIEYFKVKPEKPGPYVKFRLRPKQVEVHETRLAEFKAGRPAKQLNLKTRRYGFTTYELVESVTLVLRIPGWIGSTIAKDDDDAKKFFRIVRETFKQIPQWVLGDLGLQLVTLNRQTLTVRHLNSPGGFMESSYTIFTANSETGIGRGSTNNKLHPTEPPHYKAKAQEDYSAIQPSLGMFPGNVETWESTACGFDGMFEPQWREARDVGEEYDPSKHASRFIRHFIPAYMHPNFYIPFERGAKEARRFEALLGEDAKFGGAMELFYLNECVLPYQRTGELPHDCLGTKPEDRGEEACWLRAMEQMAYRRMAVVDLCKPDGHPRCQQEFPFTPEEAFRSTGNSFFDQEKLEGWSEVARKNKVGVVGGFVVVEREGVQKVEWVADKDGLWLLREDRKPGNSYCWGADTASGVQKHADGRTEGDFPTCTIGELQTGRVVALFRGHIKSKEHAFEVAKGTCYFGWAPGYAERAVTGDAGTMLTELEQLELCGVSAVDCVLRSTKEVWSDQGQVIEQQIGFTTRVGTKKVLCDHLATWWSEEVEEPAAGLVCPIDEQTSYEMKRFRRVQSGKSDRTVLKGVGAHDDCVLSLALMIRARRVLLEEEPDKQTKVEEEEDDSELLNWLARTAESDALEPLAL